MFRGVGELIKPVGTFSDPLSNTDLRNFSKTPQIMVFRKALNHMFVI